MQSLKKLLFMMWIKNNYKDMEEYEIRVVYFLIFEKITQLV